MEGVGVSNRGGVRAGSGSWGKQWLTLAGSSVVELKSPSGAQKSPKRRPLVQLFGKRQRFTVMRLHADGGTHNRTSRLIGLCKHIGKTLEKLSGLRTDTEEIRDRISASREKELREFLQEA